MPVGLGVLILLVLAAIGGGVAAASRKREPEKLPPPAPPAPEPPTFQPAPQEPARLPPSRPLPTYYTPAVAPSAKDIKLRQLATMVKALGPEPGISAITEALILSQEIGAVETTNVLTDRLKVAVARVQEQERLKVGR